ncbi:MAG: amidohydrolase family protein, partial [Pyrinomonadaceae bacterium]
MKKAILMFLILSISTISTVAQASTPKSGTVVFVGVNVIPMDKERVLMNQTVLVRNGLILVVGDTGRTKLKLPKDAQIIDGTWKFLIPGLTDMHVHLFTDDEFPDGFAEDEFKIMIAHGVTTIRLMTGTPEQLVLRSKGAKEEILAPTIYAASPQFTGRKSSNAYVVTTEPEARAAVRKSKQDGYDFIKVTTFLQPE